MQTALAAAGATFDHVVKWNIYVVQGRSIQLEALQRVGSRPEAPVISLTFICALAHSDFLVEIDAIAAVPQWPRERPLPQKAGTYRRRSWAGCDT